MHFCIDKNGSGDLVHRSLSSRSQWGFFFSGVFKIGLLVRVYVGVSQ